MVIVGFDGLLVRQCRIQLNSYQSGSGRPLASQVVGRTDDQHPAGHSIGQELMGDSEREARFPRSGCRRREEVLTRVGQDAGYGANLPLAQFSRPRRQGHYSLFFMGTMDGDGLNNEGRDFMLSTHAPHAFILLS